MKTQKPSKTTKLIKMAVILSLRLCCSGWAFHGALPLRGNLRSLFHWTCLGGLRGRLQGLELLLSLGQRDCFNGRSIFLLQMSIKYCFQLGSFMTPKTHQQKQKRKMSHLQLNYRNPNKKDQQKVIDV